jgi:hypothetical protein
VARTRASPVGLGRNKTLRRASPRQARLQRQQRACFEARHSCDTPVSDRLGAALSQRDARAVRQGRQPSAMMSEICRTLSIGVWASGRQPIDDGHILVVLP